MTQDLSQFSMRDLFRIEAEGQAEALTTALLTLDKDPMRADQIEACMRAAHSLKGAARIVEIHAAVTIAHAMEDLFVLAQQRGARLDHDRIDVLLRGVDLLLSFARSPDLESGSRDEVWQVEADRFVLELNQPPQAGLQTPVPAPISEPAPVPATDDTASASASTDRALRVSAENLNRLLDLAGESLVESRWLGPFGQSLQRLKRLQLEAAAALESLRTILPTHTLDERAKMALDKAQQRLLECRQHLSQRLGELETTDHQATTLAHRLYDQALAMRMRPFSDGIAAYPRMVRDVARELDKKVRLEIVGERTLVDRDILDRLDAPLGHLLRNALDHGIESPGERLAAGKADEGVVRLEASHRAGTLQITVSDDGRGVDLERIRQTVIARNLASPDTAGKLGTQELLEFLFLPGFSMKGEVTVISGRGVGLDVVQEMIRQVRGLVRVTSELGEGTRFKLELPLTLSVVRSLIVEIGGEPYAFPFAHIVRAIKIASDQVQTLEGRQHFSLDGQLVGLVGADQVLGCKPADNADGELRIVVVGSPGAMYGLVVERFLGGRELVVQPLDPRLGKIKDISAAALMEDGSPLLIIDVEDIIRSMEKLSSADQLAQIGRKSAGRQEERRKRVLVVDDSLTVRELQRKLLDHHGYEVEVAVDGMDGWNALRNGRFDLLISDIDMPRIDGIELVHRIRQDPDLKSLPVMIVSYKDRAEDRQRGLDAGADYYLTKGSFQDDTLIDAVVDLIGEAVA
ncbi:hybrid sensor histidine kinase/response regulator [Labrys sp. ZIDIC5]|uniref:hybrid sensor histidine kinase/response regulator n=1 Tax=Labrys sedimenti TaxID=3106036 RepID=UPI002ACAF99D|nr:hybrid sensor histidine kinase/response regulator [Labrys sp. ZIDIC5]MDZ5451040.1 hybrid sensor histidine kinase/response regulator [Labrys sp. ZIDIC5]